MEGSSQNEDARDRVLESASARRRSRVPPSKGPAMVLALFAAAVTGGAIGGALWSGLTPGEAVSGAVAAALNANTAHLSLHGAIGGSSSISGTGSIDFSTGALSATLTGPLGSSPGTIDVVYASSTVYVQIPQLSQIDPGKSWLAIDVRSLAKDQQVSGLPTLGADPAAALRLLEAQGNKVTPLGASTVDGQSVTGYAIDYNVPAIENDLRNAQLPAADQALINDLKVSNATAQVYIDSSDELVRVSNALGISVAGHSGATTASVDFTDYGAPVSIKAPPPGEVVRFSQFLQSLGGSAP